MHFKIKMQCLGVTKLNQRCGHKVAHGQYCHHHKPKAINIHAPCNIITDQDCSICLMHVENDCHLICGHPHHEACIKQLLKSECPVCRGPLQFKPVVKDEQPYDNQLNDILQQSIYEDQLHKTLMESMEINEEEQVQLKLKESYYEYQEKIKNETIYEMIERLCQGQKSIIRRLNS